jgi:predicted oxidoreductase
MTETGPGNQHDWLVALLEETVRNELVHQRIVLDLSLSIIDIQAMSKGIVAEVLSRFAIDAPGWSDSRDAD